MGAIQPGLRIGAQCCLPISDRSRIDLGSPRDRSGSRSISCRSGSQLPSLSRRLHAPRTQSPSMRAIASSPLPSVAQKGTSSVPCSAAVEECSSPPATPTPSPAPVEARRPSVVRPCDGHSSASRAYADALDFAASSAAFAALARSLPAAAAKLLVPLLPPLETPKMAAACA